MASATPPELSPHPCRSEAAAAPLPPHLQRLEVSPCLQDLGALGRADVAGQFALVEVPSGKRRGSESDQTQTDVGYATLHSDAGMCVSSVPTEEGAYLSAGTCAAFSLLA